MGISFWRIGEHGLRRHSAGDQIAVWRGSGLDRWLAHGVQTGRTRSGAARSISGRHFGAPDQMKSASVTAFGMKPKRCMSAAAFTQFSLWKEPVNGAI